MKIFLIILAILAFVFILYKTKAFKAIGEFIETILETLLD